MSVLPILPLLLIAPVSTGDEAAVEQATQSFFATAAKQQDEAFLAACVSDLSRSELVLLNTFYEVLGLAPFEVLYPEAPYVNQGRALAAFQVKSPLDTSAPSTSWLWFEQSEAGAWLVRRLDPDGDYSREWLFEEGKPGVAAEPAAAANLLLQAMQQGDRRQAERASSYMAWSGTGDGFAALHQTARDVGLRFRSEPAEVREDRAIVPFGLDFPGSPPVDSLMLLERREGGWLATGLERERQQAEAFLRGEVSAIEDPTSPFLCVERILAAIQEDRPVRLRRLASPAFRDAQPGIGRYMELASRGGSVSLPRGGLEVANERAVARVQVRANGERTSTNVLWLLARIPDGWRLVEETEIPDRAESYLAGPVEAK